MPERAIGTPDLAGGANVAEVRSRERLVGGATVCEQYVIPVSERVRSGLYIAQTGTHLVLAAADAVTVARWYLVNPLSSTLSVALRRVEFLSQLGSALVTLTCPKLQFERFTFTGTATGPTITAAKRATTDAAATATLRTSAAGITISGQTPLFAFLPVAAATAVGYNSPGASDWNPDEDGRPVLAAGEGIMLRQADAGTASDTRRYVTNIAWDEFQVA